MCKVNFCKGIYTHFVYDYLHKESPPNPPQNSSYVYYRLAPIMVAI